MKCINISHPEFKALLSQSNKSSFDLELLISKWQEDNNTYDFPNLKEITNDVINNKLDKINFQKAENLAESKFYYDTTISEETRDFIQTLVKNFPKIASQIKIIDNKAAWNKYVGEDANYMGYWATDENGMGYILLNRGKWAKTDTLAHEMLHAFTQVILDNPETQAEKDYVKNLTVLFNQFKGLKEAKTDYEYQANDINEFLAYSLTSKEFQSFLKSKFTKEQKSLFQELVDLIKSLFGNKIEKSYLEKITNLTKDIINKSDYKNYKSRIQLINSQTLEGKGELSNQSIQGVQELFDSNPELANQVYEALGFVNDLPFTDNIIETDNKDEKKKRLNKRREIVLNEINTIEELIRTNPDEITVYYTGLYENDYQQTKYLNKSNWEKSTEKYKTFDVIKKPSYLHSHLDEDLQKRIKNLQVINSSLYSNIEEVNYSNIFQIGKNYSSLEILKYISNNKKDALSSIAEKLLKYSEKNNVEVSILEKGERSGVVGSYSSFKNKIEIYGKNSITSHTLIHEIVHSLSVIDINLNPNSKQVKSLENILKNILDKRILKEYENFESSYEDYATKNIKELLSEIISRPDILSHLALYDTNYNLITSKYKEETLLDEIIKIISNIFNFTKKESETLADAILLNAVQIFENSKTTSNYQSKKITPQQKQQALQFYSSYLDTIFPNSQVKDILLHGSPEINLQNPNASFKRGFYATAYEEMAKGAGGSTNWDKVSRIYRVILNAKNPRTELKPTAIGDMERNPISYIKEQGYDSFVINNQSFKNNRPNEEVVVFEPEQIHILGSKQDIEGFKEFVRNETDNYNEDTDTFDEKDNEQRNFSSEEDYLQSKLSINEVAEQLNNEGLRLEQIINKNPKLKPTLDKILEINPTLNLVIAKDNTLKSSFDPSTNQVTVSLVEVKMLADKSGLPVNEVLESIIRHELNHAYQFFALQNNMDLEVQANELLDTFKKMDAFEPFIDTLRSGFRNQEGETYQYNLEEFLADINSNANFIKYTKKFNANGEKLNIFKQMYNSFLRLFGIKTDTFYEKLVEFISNDEFVNEAKTLIAELNKKGETIKAGKRFATQNDVSIYEQALYKRIGYLTKKLKEDPNNAYLYKRQLTAIEEKLILLRIPLANKYKIFQDFGESVLDDIEKRLKSHSVGNNEVLDMANFYEIIDLWKKFPELATKASILERDLNKYKEESFLQIIHENLHQDEKPTLEQIRNQRDDVKFREKWTGSLRDTINYISNAIGNIIGRSQTVIEERRNLIFLEIQEKVKFLESSGRKIQDIYDELIEYNEIRDTYKLIPESVVGNTSKEAQEFYYFYKEKMKEFNNLLPTLTKRDKNGRLEIITLSDSFIPNVPKSDFKAFLAGLNPLKKRYIGDFTRDEDDKNDIIAIDYITKIKGSEKSLNLGHSLYAFASTVYNYDEMSRTLPKVRLLQREIYNTKFIQGSDPNTTKTGTESGYWRMTEDFINAQVKGAYKSKEGRTAISTSEDEYGNITETYVDVAGSIDTLLSWNSLLRIGLAPITAVANISFGKLSNFIEAWASGYLTELGYAEVIFFNQTFDKDSVLNKEILTKLNILQELTEYTQDNVLKTKIKGLDPAQLKEYMFSLQKGGEKYIQSTMLLAIMIKQGYLTKDGKLTNKYLTITDLQKTELINEVQRTNHLLHGRYTPKESAIAQQYVLYRAMSQFRKWIPSAIESRFGSKRYDQRLKRITEGRILTFAIMVYNLKDSLKRMSEGKLKDYEIYNLRKLLIEVVLTIGTYVLMAMLKGGDEKDDKERRKTAVYKTSMLLLTRVAGDLSFFFSPNQINNLFKNIAPVTKLTQDLLDIAENLIKFWEWDDKTVGEIFDKGTNLIPGNKLIKDPYKVFNKEVLQELR